MKSTPSLSWTVTAATTACLPGVLHFATIAEINGLSFGAACMTWLAFCWAVGSTRDDEFGKLQVAMPARTAPTTQSAYVIVDDCDQHHARVVAAGAEVIMPPQDQDYGGRLYMCRDLEGHVWSFGTYDPWHEG